MKKFVLLCTILAALCCMAYAETLTDDAAYSAAKERYYQLFNKVADGSATYAESVEFGDLCQVYSLEVPAVPEEERDRGSLDQGGGDCDNAEEIPQCPYSDAGNFDGDNDCFVPTAAPSNEVFYHFVPSETRGYTMRCRSYSGTVPGIRVVTTACCTGATNPPNWFYSAGSVATDCGEPVTVVTYLYVYLNAGQEYWIHVGTSTTTIYTSAYEFDMWCVPCPPMEPAAVHNSCATAWEIACNDSIMGDSAYTTLPSTPDWYKVVVPDYSPLACSLRVFVGGRELGHCISGKYPAYTSAPLGAPDGRATIWREQPGNPCVLDSLRKIDDEGCSYDAKGAVFAIPGTYYIKVWNLNVSEYVLTTECFVFDPIAACCFLDASCQNLAPPACAAAGGWSKPIGVLCDPNPCPAATCPGDLRDDEQVNNACSPEVPEVVCDGWYCGVIPAVSDTDWYKFVVPEGVCETLWVDIYGNDTPSMWPYLQGLDPYVELWKDDCVTRLGYNYDNNGVDPLPVLDDSRLKYTITRAGTYYIKIRSEYGLVGPYLMHITCQTFECPDLTGDVCEDPRIIPSLPYSESHTTCDYTNDYNPTTCLGTLYGTGPDVIYKLTLDGSTCFTCTLTAVGNTGGSPYASISLWSACPTPTGACIASDIASPYIINMCGTVLAAGDYYIQIDNWPSPVCINYTLKIDLCDCPVPCESYTLCGSPGEVEPNDVCPVTTAQSEITCGTTVYGLHCPATDKDFWKVTVAPMSVMTLKLYSGATCSVNPAVGVLFRTYNDLCASPTTGVATSLNISNMTTDPLVKYLEVYDTGGSQMLYKVEATCCQVTNYCEAPKVIHNGPLTFADTVNTCCATRAVDSVRSTSCTVGSWYKSGPSVIYHFTLSTAGVLDITVGGYPSGDVQFMVFTDCANSAATCWASRDASSPEVITGLALPAGAYYLAVMYYDGTAPYDNCGSIYVNIASDVPLPVNLLGDVVATPGNEKVTLSWTTASETNNARFEIVRDGRVIGQVEGAGTYTTRKDYLWSEEGLNNGTIYSYTLRSVDINEHVNELATVEATPSFAAGEVTEYALHQNYPNPFNPVTTIAFDLLESGNVTLKIYNLMGQEVRTVVNGVMPQGRQIVSFDAGNLSSGIYLYRIEVNGFAAEKKMLLMK